MSVPNLVWLESFDYAAGFTTGVGAFSAGRYEGWLAAGGGSISANAGRGLPQRGAMIGNFATGLYKDFDQIPLDGGGVFGPQTCVGFGFAINRANTFNSSQAYFTLYDGPGPLALPLVEIRHDATTGHLVFSDLTSGIDYDTGYLPPINGFFHVEGTVCIGTNANAGRVEIRLNGVPTPAISLPAGTLSIAGTFGRFLIYVDRGPYMSDFYLHDGGGDGTVFAGDLAVEYFPASADGPNQDATPTGAATNLDAVDDLATAGWYDQPPADGDYANIAAAGVPHTLDFFTQALPVNAGSIVAIEPLVLMSKDNAGRSLVRVAIETGGTQDDGAGVQYGLITNNAYYGRVVNLNPSTGLRFTPTERDNTLVRVIRDA